MINLINLINITKFDTGKIDDLFEFLKKNDMILDGEKSKLADLIEHNPGLNMIALDDKRIIGNLSCSFNGFQAYLFKLVVDRDYRGQHIGSKLLSACETALKQKGCKEIFIHCRKFLEEFYKSNGYEPAEDQVIYSKKLAEGDGASCPD